MIDLEYFVKPLHAKGHTIVLFIDANQDVSYRFREQDYHKVFKSDNGFHVDGIIDGSLRMFMENCDFENILATIHGPDFPKTHNRGSKQIDVALVTPDLPEHVK
jgi:hypothetical protein